MVHSWKIRAVVLDEFHLRIVVVLTQFLQDLLVIIDDIQFSESQEIPCPPPSPRAYLQRDLVSLYIRKDIVVSHVFQRLNALRISPTKSISVPRQLPSECSEEARRKIC